MSRKRNIGEKKGIVLIKKANQLIESRYKFDIWETRFFLSVLSQVRREDDEFRVYRIWYRDVIKTFSLKSGDSYAFLRTAANNLMEKSFFVTYETEGVTREVRYHVLRKIDYLQEGQEGREGGASQEYVDVTVEPEMKPLLLQLQKNFTAYELRNVARLGVYPMRVYELLKQYESIGSRTLGVDEIKKMFEIGEEYARFPDFNRWVIQPAVRDINKHTDIEVTDLQYIKESRRVKSLRFVFHKKNRDEATEAAGKEHAAPVPLLEPGATKQAPGHFAPETPEPHPLNAFAERLFDWWGIQPEAFLKQAATKTPRDVDAAIAFTQERIRAGKAANPAGVFLNALEKGHLTTGQQSERKKTGREQKDRDREAQTLPLAEACAELQGEYNRALNEAIRDITQQNPAATDVAIGRIKANFRTTGMLDVEDRTVEDFRQSPMLRALVKAEIMKDDPARFAAINAHFGPKIRDAKARVLALDPHFIFA